MSELKLLSRLCPVAALTGQNSHPNSFFNSSIISLYACRVLPKASPSSLSLLFPSSMVGMFSPQQSVSCCSHTLAYSKDETSSRSKTTTAACAWQKQLQTTVRYRSCPAVSHNYREQVCPWWVTRRVRMSMPIVVCGCWVLSPRAYLRRRDDLPTETLPRMMVLMSLLVVSPLPSLIYSKISRNATTEISKSISPLSKRDERMSYQNQLRRANRCPRRIDCLLSTEAEEWSSL